MIHQGLQTPAIVSIRKRIFSLEDYLIQLLNFQFSYEMLTIRVHKTPAGFIGYLCVTTLILV